MKEVFPYTSENINRRIQYFAENELERHAVALAANQNTFTAVHRNGVTTYKSSFKATYSWESLLEDWFESIAPYLKDGSSMPVYPDSGHYEYVVKDGKAVMK